jgi:hypothetical protein
MSMESAAGASPQMLPHDERGRSQRVILRVDVKLHVSIEGKPNLVAAFTANVNDHSALIVSPESFQQDERFILEHNHSRQRIGCRVRHKPQSAPDGFQIGVEFDQAAPAFWHIAFPPTNWKAET